nr:YrbL family protein [Malaciobacter halophilus]
MIDLSKLTPLGKGTNRVCFIHPKDQKKCIKVTHSNDHSEAIKEIKYYDFLKKRKISWQFLAKYYGSVDTSLGKGEVFDLVRDYDGTVSKTLSFYLQEDKKTKSLIEPIKLLNELKEYTLKENIVVKDLNTKNMLYQKINDNEAQLILIDGVVNNDFLPFSKYIPFLTQKKIKRLWKRFEESLPNKYFFNNYFLSLLNEKI